MFHSINDIKIRWKLGIAPVMIVCAALVLGLLAWRMSSAQEQALEGLTHGSFAKTQRVADLGAVLLSIDAGLYRAITWQNAGADDAVIKGSIEATTKQFDTVGAILDALDKSVDPAGEERATLAEVRGSATAYLKKAAEVLDMLDGDPVMAVTLLRQAGRLYEKVGQAVGQWSALQKRNNDALVDQTSADSRSWLTLFFAIMAAAFGGSVLVIHLVGYGIATGINGLTQVMTRLAGGDTEVIPPGAERGDEIGDMAKAVLVFREHAIENDRLRLAQAVEQERAQEHLRSEMMGLSEVLEGEVSTTVGDISLQAERLSEGAANLSDTAEQLRVMAQAVLEAIETASGNVQTVADAAAVLDTASQGITGQLRTSSDLTESARREVEKASASVGGLTEASARIGDVVNLIRTIAGQTRMLALNATIEAARAGDAGKGFAVVAEEVKTLALQTEDGIGKVNAQAQGIGRTTSEAVETVQAVVATIHDIDAVAADVAAAAEEQRSATAQIMTSATQAAGHTRTVAGHAKEMLTGADKTGVTARRVTALSSLVCREIAALHNRLSVILRNSCGGNRRSYERVPAAIPFTLVLDGKDFRGRTADISYGGALLVPNDRCDMESGEGVMELEGVGRINVRLLVCSAAGLHVRFIDLEDGARIAISKAVEKAGQEDIPLVALARQIAERASALFEGAIRDGALSVEHLFDTSYEPVAGSDPEQFIARHTEVADRGLPTILEQPLEANSQIVFCVVTDRNGYVSTHNRKYSQPQRPGETAWNVANCRNHRLFSDRAAVLAARNTTASITQTYARDMGDSVVVLKEIDVPITVRDQHWGAVRLAVKL